MEEIGAAAHELLVQGGHVVHPEVDVEEIRLDDLAVRSRLLALVEVDVALVPLRVAVRGRVGLPLAGLEAQLVAVVLERLEHLRDDQHRRKASNDRHASDPIEVGQSRRRLERRSPESAPAAL